MEKKIIFSKEAQPIIGPYVQAVLKGDRLLTSGQLGILPGSGTLPDGIEAQTWQALDNIKALLDEAGFQKKDILRATVYLTDMADFKVMNEVYMEFFGKDRPARVCVAVSGLPYKALVMIDVEAMKG